MCFKTRNVRINFIQSAHEKDSVKTDSKAVSNICTAVRMQMKMEKKTMNKQALRQLLEKEDDFITTLFRNCEVPTQVDDEEMIEQYLLETDDTKKRPLPHNPKQKANGNHSSIDLEERLEIMQNKIKSKKVKASARALEKKKQKKLKKTKELQKKLISAAKSLKNEKAKGEKGEKRLTADANDVDDVKPEVKPDVKPPKTFNEEGKLVFSKFEFAAQPSRATKPKKDKQIKDPKLLMQKLRKEKEQINELIAQGDVDKAEELKKDIAWKKAFDKTDGKKIKDNASLLHKTLHRRKVEKKKSKKEWKDREQKIEKEKEGKAKKREDNINKRKEENKKYKMKKAAKRGRVIPGY